MAEPDKDLPLVVAEILIEMHGLNSRMERVENTLVQAVDTIRQLGSSVKGLADTVLLQQQENNKRFDLLMEADRANTTMLINAFREEAAATRARLDSIENRIDRLENR